MGHMIWPIQIPYGLGFTKRRELTPGKRTSARVNFGTRTSAPISKNFINFGAN